MTAGPGIDRRRWKAPRENGALLQEPPLRAAGELAAANRAELERMSIAIDGQPLHELRRSLRAELQGGGGGAPTSAEGAFFVTGHQPLLAHPGVWTKNMAVAVLAQAHQGVGLNLIVDNDVAGPRVITIPEGSRETPRLESVPFDAASAAGPWEEAIIEDRRAFAAFGAEVTSRVRETWGFAPVLESVWPSAAAAADRGEGLAAALSAARIELERILGLGNREVRLSDLAGTTAFLHFVRHVAVNAPPFLEAHNRRLADYRRLNRVRSHSHPVADLAHEGDRFEIPFWVWKRSETHRRRVFAERKGDQIELSDGRAVFARLDAAARSAAAVNPLRELRGQGVRLRPRALATTLFARFVLADLFVHGIGGAKYDELSDAIAEDFFGVRPPPFLTLTATFHLPLGGGFVGADGELRAVDRALRDARYNAERILADPPAELVSEKRQLVDQLVTLRKARRDGQQRLRQDIRKVARRLRTTEERLAAGLEPEMERLRQDRHSAERRVAANRVLQSREFAAVLFPAADCRSWVERIRSEVRNGS